MRLIKREAFTLSILVLTVATVATLREPTVWTGLGLLLSVALFYAIYLRTMWHRQ